MQEPTDEELIRRMFVEQKIITWEIFARVYGHEHSEEFTQYVSGKKLPDKVREYCIESFELEAKARRGL